MTRYRSADRAASQEANLEAKPYTYKLDKSDTKNKTDISNKKGQTPTCVNPESFKQLEHELHELITVRRIEVSQRLMEARRDGDISESAEYEDAKAEQSWVEWRINALQTILARAVVYTHAPLADGRVSLGSKILLQLDDTPEPEEFTLVSSAEYRVGTGHICDDSPIGSVLIGKRATEAVVVDTPGGVCTVTVLEVL